LAETKNGSVIRKHIRWGHIGSQQASEFDRFYRQHFNPYLNFHRPCGVPEVRTDSKGRQKRVYPRYATPWEILQQLPGFYEHLREKVTAQQLASQAASRSDLDAARSMQTAKHALFASLRRKTPA
jgi:hypothetical protein